MKRKIITIILTILASATISIPVMAEPAEESTENMTSEEEFEPEDSRPIGSKDDEANGYKLENFDEMGDYIVKSNRSDYNCSQISFHCMIPNGFTHGIILEVKNETEDLKFRFVATKPNNYSCHMAVPAGKYRVINCYVDGDTTLSYPLTIPDDFVLEENQTLTVESTLKNYAEVESEADRRLNPDKTVAEEPIKEDVPESLPDDSDIVPWRRVKHTGDGKGVLTIVDGRGGCKIPINLVVEITGTGGDKKGEYRYSTDGGITYADICVIRTEGDVSIITTDTKEDTGLKMSFGTGEFLIYDKYFFDCDIEYPVSTDVLNGNGNIRITSPETIYSDSYKIRIKMVKTGGNGSGIFVYSLNGGLKWSDEETIPANGMFHIPDTQLVVTFWANEKKGNTFMVSDMYSCDIRGDMSKRSVAPYVLGLIACLVIAAYYVAISLHSQKSKPWEYTLNVYKPVELKPKKVKKQ